MGWPAACPQAAGSLPVAHGRSAAGPQVGAHPAPAGGRTLRAGCAVAQAGGAGLVLTARPSAVCAAAEAPRLCCRHRPQLRPVRGKAGGASGSRTVAVATAACPRPPYGVSGGRPPRQALRTGRPAMPRLRWRATGARQAGARPTGTPPGSCAPARGCQGPRPTAGLPPAACAAGTGGRGLAAVGCWPGATGWVPQACSSTAATPWLAVQATPGAAQRAAGVGL